MIYSRIRGTCGLAPCRAPVATPSSLSFSLLRVYLLAFSVSLSCPLSDSVLSDLHDCFEAAISLLSELSCTALIQAFGSFATHSQDSGEREAGARVLRREAACEPIGCQRYCPENVNFVYWKQQWRQCPFECFNGIKPGRQSICKRVDLVVRLSRQ